MKYKVILEESDEGFAASVPGLPGCHSQGSTEQEALESIADAIRTATKGMFNNAEMSAAFLAQQPLDRHGEADDIAQAVRYFAGPESSWVTGQLLTVDGGNTLLVWDWERFTPGVPLGFDALHHDLQRRIAGGTDPRTAVSETLAAAGRLLLPFGVAADDAVSATALLYLVDLGARYVSDRQAEAGARLGVLGRWLLPAILDQVGDL